MHRPRRPCGPLPQTPIEVGDEPAESCGVLGALAHPLRRIVLLSGIGLDRAQALTPLLSASDDPGIARERVPARPGDPSVLVMQSLREPRVGEEVHHRLP